MAKKKASKKKTAVKKAVEKPAGPMTPAEMILAHGKKTADKLKAYADYANEQVKAFDARRKLQ